MQNQLNAPGGFRQTAYIFLAGLVIGVFIGWSMHGVVGLIIRLALFAGAVALVVFAVNFWQNTRRERDNSTIDATWRETRR